MCVLVHPKNYLGIVCFSSTVCVSQRRGGGDGIVLEDDKIRGSLLYDYGRLKSHPTCSIGTSRCMSNNVEQIEPPSRRRFNFPSPYVMDNVKMLLEIESHNVES